MANCHASLDSTCKRRISKLSHLVSQLVHSTSLILNWEMKIYIDIFCAVSGNIKCITVISNLHFLIGKIVYPHFQMALSWWKKGLWQICTHNWTVHAKVEFQKFFMLGGIPQLLILNWEMKDLHWYLLWAFLQY